MVPEMTGNSGRQLRPLRTCSISLKNGASPGGCSAMRYSFLARPVAVLAALILCSGAASAHTGESGLVLLLPTGYTLVGGTLAVLLSVILTFFYPADKLEAVLSVSVPLGIMRLPAPGILSTLTGLFLLALVLSGLFGSSDPRANPLPVTIWSVWWGVFVFVQALLGDVWSELNPLIAPGKLIERWRGLRPPPITYPSWLGFWPASLGFFYFSWLELVDLAPDDPRRLATLVIAYLVSGLVGMLLFGAETWLQRADPFSFFLRLVGQLAPFETKPVADDTRRRHVCFVLPGSRLMRLGAIPLSGTLFVLMTLSAVSFDGLSRTFWWLDLAGVNPLEFPGRSKVLAFNSAGLVGIWLVLGAAYLASIRFGCRIEPRWQFAKAAGTMILSIVPIALAYHFAHYVTVLSMELQYVVEIYSVPLHQG